MNRKSLRSDWLRTLGLLYSPLVFAIFLMAASIGVFLFADYDQYTQSPTSDPLMDSLILLALGIVLLIIFYLLKDRVVEVKVEADGLLIKQHNTRERIAWANIRSVKRLMLTSPTLYRLRLKDRKIAYFFYSEGEYTFRNALGLDPSHMMAFIRAKEREGLFNS